jgi:hypothetical protein
MLPYFPDVDSIKGFQKREAVQVVKTGTGIAVQKYTNGISCPQAFIAKVRIYFVRLYLD